MWLRKPTTARWPNSRRLTARKELRLQRHKCAKGWGNAALPNPAENRKMVLTSKTTPECPKPVRNWRNPGEACSRRKRGTVLRKQYEVKAKFCAPVLRRFRRNAVK